MSNAPPARSASFDTVATTSPVECCPRIAWPARDAWCPTTWTSRNEARSQFWTAKRCRITPAAPWTIPRPRSRAAHVTSAAPSSSTIPSWMARPIVYGMSAWATIHAIPKATPSTREPTC